MAVSLQIGLPNWTDSFEGVAPKPVPAVRRALFRLSDTPLEEGHRAWIGQRVLDRRGDVIGRVREVMVEQRSLEEVAREDAAATGWGVRAVYAVVNVRRGWFRRASVLLPVARLRQGISGLTCDEDALLMRSLLR